MRAIRGWSPRRSRVRRQALVVAGRPHDPGLAAVAQVDVEDPPQAIAEVTRSYRSDHLDPAREIPGHPVGGADVEIPIPGIRGPVGEVKDPRVLQETPDDGPDLDGLSLARHAGTQAAEAPDHQVDR